MVLFGHVTFSVLGSTFVLLVTVQQWQPLNRLVDKALLYMQQGKGDRENMEKGMTTLIQKEDGGLTGFPVRSV